MKFLAFIFSFLFISFLNAQGGWKKYFYPLGALNSTSKDLIMIPNGNIIVTGFVSDTLNNNTTNSLCYIGFDVNGNYLWQKKYGNSKFQYLDNVLQCRGALIKNQTHFYQALLARDSNNTYLSVLLKLNFNGDTIWQKKYYSGVTGENLYLQDLSFSVDGGFLLSGFIEDFNNNRENLFILKTDVNGNELWRKNLISTSTISPVWTSSRAVQDSLTKRIISVGYQYINGDSFSNVLITDSLGNILHHKNFSDNIGGVFLDLIQSKDKKFIAVGANEKPVMFGIYHGSVFQMVKFDVSGNLIWSKEYTSPSIVNSLNTINETSDGKLILGGNLDTLKIYGLGLNSFNRVFKTDENGNLIWKRDFDFNSNNNNQDMLRSVNLSNDGNILATAELITGSPSPHPYIIIKIDSTGCDTLQADCKMMQEVGISDFTKQTGFQFSVYPNPANDFVQIKLDAPFNEKFKFQLNDVSGTEVQNLTIQGGSQLTLNTSTFEQGVYFVSLMSCRNIVWCQKLVIIR